MLRGLTAYRSSSLRIELNVQDIFLVANATRNNQQRLEESLSEERDRDRRADDRLCVELSAQIEKLQLHRRGTEHHRTDVQVKPKPMSNSKIKTQGPWEHQHVVPYGQKSLTVSLHSSPRSNIVSGPVNLGTRTGDCGDLSDVWECSRACQCSCHIRQRLNTPRLLDEFLGALFIGYSGSQIIQRCNQKACREQNTFSATFMYQLPRWFIVS